MNFFVAAETDVGIAKATNQDSVCAMVADTSYGQIAMCVVCDGMGGLSKGELASACVVRGFREWFENELPNNLENFRWDYVSEKWTHMIKKFNRTIGDYGKYNGLSLGTTVSAILLFNGEYMIAHVGDSRVYSVSNELKQLTDDHSVVGREVQRGTMTAEEAERDPRRNVLLQCVGASRAVSPQIIRGEIENDTSYLLCSDGFRHVVSAEEIFNATNPKAVNSCAEMKGQLRKLIDLAMSRDERDNISALLIHAKV